MAGQRDPVMEARLRLEAKLETLPGWQLIKGIDYTSDLDLYRTVYDTWTRNWDATDPRYYHLEASETFLLRRWEEFDTIGHLFHYGPKGSGKNQALEIHQRLAPRPILCSGPSVNAIYQIVDMLHPTLFMDECDRLGNTKESGEYVQAMLQILNVYRKGTVTIRGTQEGVVRVYDLFCPKILAGTVPLPGTLPDRTIRIDCERNAKDVPIDLDIPDTLKGQLMRYSVNHADHNELSKDQLKTLLQGDNRLTQLYFPLFNVCPDPHGQKAILDLALEDLNERRQEESYSDLAQVLEAIVKEVEAQLGPGATIATVVSEVEARDPFRIDLQTLVQDCKDLIPKGQEANRWLGWRLRRLQIPRERVGHTNLRQAIVPVRVLAKKLRRYSPSLLYTAKTTVTTVAKKEGS